MSTSMDIQRLLVSAAAQVDWPEPPDIASTVVERLRTGERWVAPQPVRGWYRHPALAFVAAIVLAFAVTLLFSPGVRRAVADFIGIGGVVIRSEPSPGSPPPSLVRDLIPGEPANLEGARSEIDWELKVPSVLGDPDEVYVDGAVPDKAVSLVYLARPGLPEIDDSKVGALLTQFKGFVGEDVIGKLANFSDVKIQQVAVGDNPGYFIRGTHTYFLYDANGQFREDTLRLAENALIWTEGEITYRLETHLPLAAALAIADTV